MLPHADVHGRRREHGAAEGQRRLREHAVGKTVGELGERVRRHRRDGEQVGLDEVRIELARHLSPRERLNVSREKVSASGVSSGVTSCPSRTRSRQSSHAL
jgi:hypothetical protein